MKKIISVTLILALLSGTMAGCGADRADNVNAADKTRNAETDAGTEVNSPVNEQKTSSPDALSKTADPDGYTASEDFHAADLSAEDPYAEDFHAEDFYSAAVSAFLSGAGNENRICSPLNIYMALAMLAEITDGESRAQILTLLGEEDLETLRDTASERWLSNYRDDEHVTNILASSLWLDEDIPFRQEAADKLSEYYHASVHQGEMGSAELNRALQDWLNEQTGGLLEEQASGMGFREDTLLALASTLYFKAGWSSQFSESRTQDGIFHGNAGDVECPFMHRSSPCNYYQGENFSAVPLYFQACGNMWLILPDEGTAVDELLRENTELLDLISTPDEWKDQKFLNVNLSVPKFDAVSQMDLQAQLKMLGVKDIFDPERSDLSPAMDDPRQAFVSQISHAARVKIDEKGCEAAAFTVVDACGAAMPPEEEIDFVLDRPFLFIITGSTDDLLFAGVVNRP